MFEKGIAQSEKDSKTYKISVILDRSEFVNNDVNSCYRSYYKNLVSLF